MISMSRFAFAFAVVAAFATVSLADARTTTAPNVCRATVAVPCVVKFPPRTAEDNFAIDYRGGTPRLIVSVLPREGK